MFSFEIDPKRLIEMFRKALMNNELKVGAVLRFTPTGVVTSSFALTYGAYGVYNTSYFKSYKCDMNTDIKITPIFLKNLEDMQFTTESSCKVELDISGTDLKIDAGGRHWSPILPKLKIETVGFEDSKLILSYKDNIGYLPMSKTNMDIPIHFQCKIDTSVLDLPKTVKVNAFLVNKLMTMKWDLDGPAEQIVNISENKVIVPRVLSQPEDKNVYGLTIPYMSSILTCLAGEINLTFYEKVLFITQVTPDTILTYFMSTN